MVTGTIAMILAVGILFLILVLNLAGNQKVYLMVSKWLVVVTSVTSLLIYGYGFAYVYSDHPLYALVRTLLAVCGTYIGRNEYDAISSVPGFSTWGFQIFFWFLQVIAIYTLFSAVLTALAQDMMKSLRLKMAKKGDLVLIYGYSQRATDFGRECRKNRLSVLFVLRQADPAAISNIGDMGAAYRTDEEALNPGETFLKGIHADRGRRIYLYCLDEDAGENYRYAGALKDAFREAGADPEKVTAALLGREESGIEKELIGNGKRAGFGNAGVFNQYSLAARLLVRVCQPWNEIRFDTTTCTATEDFSVLLLGFGLYGQSILRELVRNGQFSGSTFHATVVAKDCDTTAGLLRSECRAMFDTYDISLVNEDAGSLAFYELLNRVKDRTKMIVIALGSAEKNREVADQVKTLLDLKAAGIPIVCCSDDGITCQRSGSMEEERYPLFSTQNMNFALMDRLAMEVNHTYTDDVNSTAADDWKKCDYFSRMSSRASADFIPAMLRAMGLTEEDIRELKAKKPGSASDMLTVSEDGTSDPKNGILSKVQAENLGKMEHERWCAFHLSMGYSFMGWDEWERRVAIYKQQKKDGEKKLIRLGKDTTARIHICIMPWDTLNELSDRENRVTGGHVDYQQIDINNALAIPRVLGRLPQS